MTIVVVTVRSCAYVCSQIEHQKLGFSATEAETVQLLETMKYVPGSRVWHIATALLPVGAGGVPMTVVVPCGVHASQEQGASKQTTERWSSSTATEEEGQGSESVVGEEEEVDGDRGWEWGGGGEEARTTEAWRGDQGSCSDVRCLRHVLCRRDEDGSDHNDRLVVFTLIKAHWPLLVVPDVVGSRPGDGHDEPSNGDDSELWWRVHGSGEWGGTGH